MKSLLSTIDVASFIPDRYAALRPLVAGALAHFLDRLPAARKRAIAAAVRRLPAESGPAGRLVAVLHLCPTLHKLGQVLARHRALDAELRRNLQTLESRAPTTSLQEIRPDIAAALARSPLRDARVAARPIAEGSVAVVVPFSYRAARGGARLRGVLKVLRPGIESELDRELELWSELTGLLEANPAAIGAVDWKDTAEQVSSLLRGEVRLRDEQRHLAEAARQFAGVPSVQVPALLPFCTDRVTAMEFVEGTKVTEAAHLSTSERRALAGALCAALVIEPFLSQEPSAVIHGDAHAGNLLATPFGRLALLDWSLAGRLSKDTREQLAQIVLGGMTFNAARIGGAIASLAANRPRGEALADVAAESLRKIGVARPPGLAWLIELLDAAAHRGGARFSDDLLLMRKSWLSLEGVIADIAPGFDVDAAVMSAAAAQLVREWPWRIVAPPLSRGFATHLSNVDLLGAAWTMPAAALSAFVAGLARERAAGPRECMTTM